MTDDDGSIMRWLDVADAAAVQHEAYTRILAAATRAIEQRGRFLIVLAGGTTPRGVYERLRSAPADWSRWHVYFGDERCLPADHSDRNSRMARDAWLDHVAIPSGQVHPIPAEQGAEKAAGDYALNLRGASDFDLVLLGLGEDGHTASLFPGHDPGIAPGSPDALAVFNAPKPPPERVSLSAARLSRAREVLFLVTGASKQNAVARWRAGADIPARAIRPPAGVDVLIERAVLSG